MLVLFPERMIAGLVCACERYALQQVLQRHQPHKCVPLARPAGEAGQRGAGKVTAAGAVAHVTRQMLRNKQAEHRENAHHCKSG